MTDVARSASPGFSGVIFKADLAAFTHGHIRRASNKVITFGNSRVSFTDDLATSINQTSTNGIEFISADYPDGDTSSVTLDSAGNCCVYLPVFSKFALYYLPLSDRLILARTLGELIDLLPPDLQGKLSVAYDNVAASLDDAAVQPLRAMVPPVLTLFHNAVLSWQGGEVKITQRKKTRDVIKNYLQLRLAKAATVSEWQIVFAKELRSLVPTKIYPVGVMLSGGCDSAVVTLAALQAFPKVVILSIRTSQNKDVLDLRFAAIKKTFPETTILVEDLASSDILINPEWLLEERPLEPGSDIYAPVFGKLAQKAAALGVKTVLTGNGAEELLIARKTNVSKQENVDEKHTAATFYPNMTAWSQVCGQLSFTPYGIRCIDPLLTKNVYFSILEMPRALRRKKELFIELLQQSIFQAPTQDKDDFREVVTDANKKYAQQWNHILQQIGVAKRYDPKDIKSTVIILLTTYLRRYLAARSASS